LSMASQLEARAAAAGEIRETLNRYAMAMHHKKLAEVLQVRELDPNQQSQMTNTFRDLRAIEMTLIPVASPKFDPVIADPARMHELPSNAVVECALEMLGESGGGEVRREKQRLTVRLRRTAKGWIITSLL
jgi:hypothetical protein